MCPFVWWRRRKGEERRGAHLLLFLPSLGAEAMIFLDATERGAVGLAEAAGVVEEPEREARDTCKLPSACWMILLASKDTLSSLL